MPLDVTKLLVISAITMGMAHTLTKERLFAPLRDRLGGKETWLGYLVSCPYCASHYIAFALVPLTGASFIHVAPQWGLFSAVLDWFLSSILVTVLAAFLRVFFFWVDESQGLVRRSQQKVEAEIDCAQMEAEAASAAADERKADGGAAKARANGAHP